MRLPAAALLLAFLLPLFAPQPAYAYAFSEPATIAPDGTICPGIGFTNRIVTCVKENILTAAYNFLMPFAAFMATTDSAACVLAIALWGMLVASGKRHALRRDSYILAIKILLIVMATANFSNWFSMLLDAENDMLGIVSSYAINFSNLANNLTCPANGGDPSMAVWNTVDCALQTLVGGIFPDPALNLSAPGTLMLGVGGFFFACLLSSTLGILMALLGAYLIGCFLVTIARALYIFISAYIGMAVMIIILPLVLPTILFTVTKPYFDKWLRLTMTFMVQPLVLFAYLAMLVAAFDVVVYTGPNSLYRAIAGPAVDQPGFELGTWLLNGAYTEDEVGGIGIEIDEGAVQRELGAPEPVNQGMLGIAAKEANAELLDWQDGIFHTFGIGDNGVADALFDEPNLPVTTIDWGSLAANRGVCIWKVNQSTGLSYCDPTIYIVSLLEALFLAVVTAYILFKLLDFVPYIGAGIAGIPIGMPVFGVANAGGADMSPPGSGMLGKLQNRLANQFSGAIQSKSKSRPQAGGGGG